MYVKAKKLYVEENGMETGTPIFERLEIGLFTSEPGRDAVDKSRVVLMDRQPFVPDGR